VQRDPVRHEVGAAGPDMHNAQHAYWTVDQADRSQLTADIVREFGSTMVFCRTRHGADRVAKRLGQLGVTAAPIHGGLSQPKRDQALSAFARGNVAALVATDVAARGVHVDDVAAVVHFDPPADSTTYVHRSGRTARAGAFGVVIALVERGSEKSARQLQREVGIDVAVTKPSFAALISAGRDRAEADSPALKSDRGPGDRRLGDRRLGTVKFFHDGRGYGFIDIGGEADVFIHHSNARSRLTTGQRVELTVRQGQKGLEATDVVACDDREPVG
jgi:superfamily II DNA/RNA helicase